MSELAAYAAGLIDGEGYIGVHTRVKRSDPTVRYYSGRVTIGMSEPALPLLKEWQTYWGGSLTMARPASEQWASAWAWTAQGRNLLVLLEQVSPYLRLKAEQARLVCDLERYKLSLPQRRSDVSIWTPEAQAYCERIKADIHLLNAKGPRAPHVAVA